MTKANLFIFIIIIAIATGIILSLYAMYVNDKSDSSTLKSMLSDTVITANIKSKIIAESEIESLSIHVETISGQVTLRGNVPNNDIKTKVEGIVTNTEGVNAIRSYLQVDEVT